MEQSVIPTNFNEWKHCIEVDCGLALTPEFIEQRIAALENAKDYYTERFLKLYGQPYLDQVLTWFKQAQQSL